MDTLELETQRVCICNMYVIESVGDVFIWDAICGKNFAQLIYDHHSQQDIQNCWAIEHWPENPFS